MSRPSITVKLVQPVVFMTIMYFALQLAMYFGVEEKSWWDQAWDIVSGGALGLLAGTAAFVLVGAVGWVSGPIFGAIGLFGLATGGALGGLGFGTLVNLIRSPERYEISYGIVALTLTIGYFVATFAAKRVGRKFKTSVAPPASGEF